MMFFRVNLYNHSYDFEFYKLFEDFLEANTYCPENPNEEIVSLEKIFIDDAFKYVYVWLWNGDKWERRDS